MMGGENVEMPPGDAPPEDGEGWVKEEQEFWQGQGPGRTPLRAPQRTPLRSGGHSGRTPLRKPGADEQMPWQPMMQQSWGWQGKGGHSEQTPFSEPEPEFECEDIGMGGGSGGEVYQGMPNAFLRA